MLAQLAAVVTILTSAAPVPQRDSVLPAPTDSWVSPDKAKHFLMAGFVETSSFAALQASGASRSSAFIGAFALTGAVSVVRELHDKRVRNQFSFRDLVWDLAGGVAAFAVLRHTERP